jgi:starvation-inducible DNA-binding protein
MIYPNNKFHRKGDFFMSVQATVNQNQVVSLLNKQVSNWSVLYTKLHNYHWFVKGSMFFRLHEKFEELYDEAAESIDELAERILAIGGKPLATMKEHLAAASVQEASGNESAEQMVQQITADFGQIVSELKEAISTAEAAEDHPSADMLITMRSDLEKHIWMLNALMAK